MRLPFVLLPAPSSASFMQVFSTISTRKARKWRKPITTA